MKIAYNPITAEALTKAPANNDITFDLRGLNIFARGVKFKGTDTTYSVFKKHTSEGKGGYNGLVPVPSYTTTNIRYLREDGTWQALRSLTILTNGTSLGSYNGSTDQTFNITCTNIGAAPAVHNHTSNQITALTGYTGYTESTSNLALTTSDSLNTALGKLEKKGDLGVSAYNIVNAAVNGNGTIENLNEILQVLQGISDTDTIKDLLAHIPKVTDCYWANVKVSDTSNTETSPTFASVITSANINIGGLLMRAGKDSTYIMGRNNALIRTTSYNNYSPMLSMKTTNGSWELGVYTNDIVHLVYASDSNYNSNINDVTNIEFPKKTGIVALVLDIPTEATLDARYVTLATNLNITGIKTFTNNVIAPSFIKSGSSDLYVLLGGGGQKALSDFVLKSDELNTNVITITKNLNVTLAWMDTGIEGTNLPANGTYIVLVYVGANDGTGGMWFCYSSGIMSWYTTTTTNDTKVDEIILHRSGHAYSKIIYLRTIMLINKPLKLLISANTNIGAAYDYTFKFRRMI